MEFEKLTIVKDKLGKWRIKATMGTARCNLALGEGEVPVLMSKAVLVIDYMKQGASNEDIQALLERADDHLRGENTPEPPKPRILL